MATNKKPASPLTQRVPPVTETIMGKAKPAAPGKPGQMTTILGGSRGK
jgi:hypothetical protein